MMGHEPVRRARLRQVVACLLSNRDMGKSELQKAVYLIERESVLRHGRLCMGYRFMHHEFGMYSPDLANDLDGLCGTGGILTAQSVRADRGEGRKYSLAEGQRGSVEPDVEEVCKAFIEVHGSRNLSSLIGHAKQTDPFAGTKKGDWIDWSRFAQEQCGGAHVLTPEMSEELKRAMKEPARRRLSRAEALRELQIDG